MTLQTKYSRLREEFISIAEPHIQEDTLQALKRSYAECIDSKRRLGQIFDLTGLIKLLEKRDILNYNNIKPLYRISEEFVNNPCLHNKLTKYATDLQSIGRLPLYNMYEYDNVACPLREQRNEGNQLNPAANRILAQSQAAPNQSILSTPQNSQCRWGVPTPNTSSHAETEYLLQQKVLSRVCERLGRSWRDVARHLDIRECEIDAIQNKHPNDLKEQSYEALKVYISQHGHSGRWYVTLIRALEKGRRKDLAEIVEDMTVYQRA